MPAMGQVKVAERGLIWALMHQAEGAREALLELEGTDLEGLATRETLRQARSLQEWPAGSLPDALIERLSTGEAAFVREISAQQGAPAEPGDCVRTLRRLQEAGAARHEDEIVALWERKKDLLHRMEGLMAHDPGLRPAHGHESA